MTNLLAIEESFLSKSEVKQALDLTNVRSLQRHLQNGQKKKFEQTLALSGIVAKGYQWFKSEGKAMLAEQGLEWTAKDFASKVYGWNKSYLFKVVKAGETEAEKIETFKTKCDEMEREGKEPNRTLEGLLKWLSTATTEGGEGEGEGGEGEETQVEERQKAIITFAWKRPDGTNVACRVMSDGTLKTTNNADELTDGINALINHLRNNLGDNARQDDPMQDYEDRLEFVMDAEEDEDESL